MQKRGVIVVRATGPLSSVERRPKLSIAGLIRQFRTRHEAIHLRHFELTTLETFFCRVMRQGIEEQAES